MEWAEEVLDTRDREEPSTGEKQKNNTRLIPLVTSIMDNGFMQAVIHLPSDDFGDRNVHKQLPWVNIYNRGAALGVCV